MMAERKNRYAAFGGEFYYSAGGANNFIGFAETIDDCWKLLDANPSGIMGGDGWDWCHCLDLTTGDMIERPDCEFEGHGCYSHRPTSLDNTGETQ